ncbi:MAG TPA: TIGR03086 family metal-binding protein [Acidimicrobiales bacterium]
MSVDLEPATVGMAAVIGRIPDGLLDRPTPCPAYALGDLLEHIGGLALAFTAAARKDTGDFGNRAPAGDGLRLPADWRARIPRDLEGLAEAWRDPTAWTGMTRAGGVDLPGEIAGFVALDEVVVHGWDVARASGQAYDCDPSALEAVLGFVGPFADQPEARQGLFGPVVEVPPTAPLLDRVIGLTGRDPAWSTS